MEPGAGMEGMYIEGKPLKLYVYNTEADSCREVTITPNGAWGGDGRYVHRGKTAQTLRLQHRDRFLLLGDDHT